MNALKTRYRTPTGDALLRAAEKRLQKEDEK